jgi:tetratricopeptide (TPR) repeat protein
LIADIEFELMGKWSEAFDIYSMTKINHWVYPGYRAGYIQLSILSDYKEAEKTFYSLLKIDPDNYKLNYWYGFDNLGLKNYGKAVDYFYKAFNSLIDKFGKSEITPEEYVYLLDSLRQIEGIYGTKLMDIGQYCSYRDAAKKIEASRDEVMSRFVV